MWKGEGGNLIACFLVQERERVGSLVWVAVHLRWRAVAHRPTSKLSTLLCKYLPALYKIVNTQVFAPTQLVVILTHSTLQRNAAEAVQASSTTTATDHYS